MIEFDNVVTNPGYYLEEPDRLKAGFLGESAKLLGIHGEFSEQVYHRLFGGLNPYTGEKLIQRLKADRKGAVEYTFNMPKSPSILAEVAGDSRIVDVQFEAVKAAMRQVEKQARLYVRKKAHLGDERPEGWRYPVRHSGNIVWAPFGHDTSRTGCAHTHVHCVVFNVAYDRTEKAWKAVELRHIDRQAIEREYTDRLVKGLRQLGYRVKREGKEFEIVGVPAEVKAAFSRRHTQIKEIEGQFDQKAAAAGKKPMSDKQRAKLSLYHRPEKRVIDHQERLRSWVSRLTDGQFKGLKELVRRARAAVRMDKWREGLQQHVAKLRSYGIEREERSVERGR